MENMDACSGHATDKDYTKDQPRYLAMESITEEEAEGVPGNREPRMDKAVTPEYEIITEQDIDRSEDETLKGYPSAVTMLDRFCDEQLQHQGYKLAKKFRETPDAWTMIHKRFTSTKQLAICRCI